MFTILKNNQGSALIISLLMLVMLSFIGIASVITSVRDMDISQNTQEKTKAFYIAEAGAERGLAQVNDSAAWRAGFSSITFGSGAYSVTITDSLTDASLGKNLKLVASGTDGYGESVIETILKPKIKINSIFKWAMFGDKKVTISGQGYYDRYDSDLGTYDTQDTNGPDGGGYMYADTGGNVGGNSIINLSGQEFFHGDVQTSNTDSANGWDVLQNDATIYGAISETIPRFDIAPIPDSMFTRANSTNNNSTGITLAGGASYNNGSKELQGNSGTITFGNGTYYFTKMDLGSATINVAAGAKAIIYLTGDFTHSGGGNINTSGVPAGFQVYTKGANVTMGGTSDISGTFYAPNAVVSVSGTGHLYGSFLGKEANVSGQRYIHYDYALSRINVPWNNATEGYQVLTWREL